MRRRRNVRAIPAALIVFGAGGLGATPACNAIVGNSDIQIANDGGADDATTPPPKMTGEASDAPDVDVATGTDSTMEMETVDAEAGAGPEVDAGCGPDDKVCSGKCVGTDDPAYGCGDPHCNPCELQNAFAGCGLSDGGAPDAGALVCIPFCKPNHGDCNGDPKDGCEVDTSADLYNCGACGHDCTNLPHVAGNVACVNGVCTFDQASCAPGYGICSTDPDDGCDTIFSDPEHCGSCTNACATATPFCSKTGNTSQPFACASGCSAGLSLCGASCVDETTDPSHCGSCSNVCPDVTGGTPTCSNGGTCGFTCNANDHLCGQGATAVCAANNDPANCGLGAACGQCAPLTNSSATCTNGTTCGHTCNGNAHACGNACPLDDDPKNCGSQCATNCAGPPAGSGTGVATCNGNACAIACTNGSTLCGTNTCVDEQNDPANCGGCGATCPRGQTCSTGSCVCNATSCAGGCCDASGTCQPGACGTGGATCAPGCPATLPESSSLALWLVGDTYVMSAHQWTDQSGAHADASCSSCPQAAAAAINGHGAVSFDGRSFFTLADPARDLSSASQAWTVFVVASPDTSAPSGANVLALSSGANAIELLRSGGSGDLTFQVLPAASGAPLVAPSQWTAGWQWIMANVDASGATLTTSSGGPVTGSLSAPAAVDYASSFIGTDPSQSLGYVGQIAEVVLFTSDLSAASILDVESYLAGRYGSLQ
jgi:hypothetical protein